MVLSRNLVSIALTAGALVFSSAPKADEKAVPIGYELRGYSQSYEMLQISRSRLTADEKAFPIRNDAVEAAGPFNPYQDDPADYWTDTKVELPGCKILGENKHPSITEEKSGDNSANATAMNNPGKAHEILDIYFCDNTRLFLIKDGKVIDSLNTEVLTGGSDTVSPAYVRWAPQFPANLYLARGRMVWFVQVIDDKFKLHSSLRQTDASFDSEEGVRQRIHFDEQSIYTWEQYKRFWYNPVVDQENIQSGLVVHIRKDGQPFLVSQQAYRFHQAIRPMVSDAIKLQLPLDLVTGLPDKDASFQEVAMPTETLNRMAVTDDIDEVKKDDCYDPACQHRASVKGLRPIEGDITSASSNALHAFHMTRTGQTDDFIDLILCRGHHSHPVWFHSPCGVTGKDQETTIDADITVITGYEENPDTPHQMNAVTSTVKTPAVNFAALAEMAKIYPRVVFAEGVRHDEFARARMDKPNRTRTGVSMDMHLMDHNGNILIPEAGSERSKTKKPQYEKDGEKLDVPFDGYEIYVQRNFRDFSANLEQGGENGLSPSWKEKDRTLEEKLKLRIPRADSGKDYYDGFSLVPVFSATDFDALNVPLVEKDEL